MVNCELCGGVLFGGCDGVNVVCSCEMVSCGELVDLWCGSVERCLMVFVWYAVWWCGVVLGGDVVCFGSGGGGVVF